MRRAIKKTARRGISIIGMHQLVVCHKSVKNWRLFGPLHRRNQARRLNNRRSRGNARCSRVVITARPGRLRRRGKMAALIAATRAGARRAHARHIEMKLIEKFIKPPSSPSRAEAS